MKISILYNEAHSFIKTNFKKVLPIYLFFIFLTVVEILIDGFIPKESEIVRITFQLLVFLFTIINSVVFIRLIKKDSRNGDFLYLLVPFLLYSIYYSFIALLGLALLFIPGIIFYFIPIVATFSDLPPFKTAIKIFKNNIGVTTFLAILSLIIELLPYSFDYLSKDFFVSSVFKIVFDFGSIYLSLIITHMAVSVYYEYVEKAQGVALEEDIKETVKV